MKLAQIKNPTDYAPALAELGFSSNAKCLAKRMLGPKATLRFDMLLLKPGQLRNGHSMAPGCGILRPPV